MTVMSNGHILRDSISSLHTYMCACTQTHTHTHITLIQVLFLSWNVGYFTQKMVG